MSLQDDIKTLLRANAPLVAAATGGIHVYDDLGGGGLNAKTVPPSLSPTPFDAQQSLKYVVVIRERTQVGTNQIADEAAQARSFVWPVEIGVFAHKTLLYSVVESIQQMIYGLLADRYAGGCHLQWVTDGKMDRAYTLDMAIAVYSLYDAHGVKTP